MKCRQCKQQPRMLSFTTNRTAPASIRTCNEDVKFADQTELPRNKQHVNVQKRPKQSIDTPMSLNMNMNVAPADPTTNEHNQATTSHLSHRQCNMKNEQRHELQITACNKTSTHPYNVRTPATKIGHHACWKRRLRTHTRDCAQASINLPCAKKLNGFEI